MLKLVRHKDLPAKAKEAGVDEDRLFCCCYKTAHQSATLKR